MGSASVSLLRLLQASAGKAELTDLAVAYSFVKQAAAINRVRCSDGNNIAFGLLIDIVQHMLIR